MEAAVVLSIFRRPRLTARVFAAIRRARPPRLFLIADGPRPGVAEDAERCAAARAAVAEVDWPCRVERAFSADHLGSGRRTATGLDQVFACVDEAIVLEDDTLPDGSFFRYAGELLARYRAEPQVMMISGSNGLGTWSPAGGANVFFTAYGSIWGWATWGRAWRSFDLSLARYRDAEADALFAALAVPEQGAHLAWLFRDHLARPADKWDVPWTLGIVLSGGLCLVPSRNLVANIGFGQDATHTVLSSDPRDIPATSADFPLRLPASRVVDVRFERWQYWMPLLARFGRLDRLAAWARALERNPALPRPDAGEGAAFSLAPLMAPREALAMLEHVAAAAPENRRVHELRACFAGLVTPP
jgi:hypothetical protein